MKLIYTLLATALLSAFSSKAQLTENFENGTAPLTSNCWQITGMTAEAASPTGDGITGNSIASAGASNSGFATPYFDFTSTNLVNVSFKITIDRPLSNHASRTITIGTKDKSGTVVNYASYTYNKTTLKVSDLFTLTANNISLTGTQRVFVNITADNGDGNTHIIIDDFTVTGTLPFHYGASPCNTAPTAGNDNFTTFNSLPYSDNVITGSDFDPNAGETISAAIATQPVATAGSVVMNPDGSFTFTPAVGFLGGPVSFTYRVTDNGYDPLSTTATVTITYPELSPLPVQLISFSGSIRSDKAQLTWMVGGNETGERFEVESSEDGKSFSTEGHLFTTAKFASESYTYTSSKVVEGQRYYRLKIINRDGSVSHSRTIVLKTAKAGGKTLQILQNPVEATLMFHYSAEVSTKAIVNIYTMSGGRMLSQAIGVQKGRNTVSIALNGSFTPGTYLLEVISGEERSVEKMIKK